MANLTKTSPPAPPQKVGQTGLVPITTVTLGSLSNRRVSNNSELSELLLMAKEVSIPLIPETTQFSDDFIKLGVTFVRVKTTFPNKLSYGKDTGEKADSNGDIYRTDNGQFALHHTKLNEIAKAAGVQIYESKLVERACDDKGSVVYISHSVKAKWRSVDGVFHDEAITGTYDYFADVASKSQKMADRRRSNADALAESKAYSRLFRKAIPQFQGSYSLSELEKPFAVPFVVDDQKALLNTLSPQDREEVNKAMVMKRLGVVEQMYPRRVGSAPLSDRVEAPHTNPAAQAAKLDPAKEVFAPVSQPTSNSGQANGELSQAEMNLLTAEEYRGAEQRDRTGFFVKLQEERELDQTCAAVTTVQFEKSNIDSQIKFLIKLLSFPAKVLELPL